MSPSRHTSNSRPKLSNLAKETTGTFLGHARAEIPFDWWQLFPLPDFGARGFVRVQVAGSQHYLLVLDTARDPSVVVNYNISLLLANTDPKQTLKLKQPSYTWSQISDKDTAYSKAPTEATVLKISCGPSGQGDMYGCAYQTL